MHSREMTQGRTFGVRFDPGESFVESLARFCESTELRYGYIPMFLAAFSEVEIVGACDKLEDPKAPVWEKVHLTNVEAIGCGTIAYDEDAKVTLPHVHTSVGMKAMSAVAHTSHLLDATVQFIVEMFIVEVDGPAMIRPRDPSLYDIPRLAFDVPDWT